MLLPAEAQLCNAVGLTEAEYWHFVELADAYTGKRKEEYSHVPDIRSDPVTQIVVTLVIGLALSAVASLLAPKPKAPKQPDSGPDPTRIRTPDVNGRSKFAPQTSFDSIQELASLGMTIPLVFSRNGLRVNSSLLWSQMLSFGNAQQFKGILLFSSGELEERPEFAGYAIGDTTLENYTNAKLALYFKEDGGRFTEGGDDRYDEGTLKDTEDTDPFSVFWDREDEFKSYFSGARTPSTQTQFGCYAPCPNGMRHMPQYEVTTVIGEGDARNALQQRRNKATDKSPYRAAVISHDEDDDIVIYRLDSSQDSGNRYNPVGSEDIKNSQNSARESADVSISVGSQYLIGSALAVGWEVPSDPWVPGDTKDVQFKVIEDGEIDITEVLDTNPTHEKLTVQSVAIGTVSNNRSCGVTEIGIKATVWGQITGFANKNAYPGDGTIQAIERDNGSYSLGNLSKYIKRLSFFKLYIRELGSNADWIDINNGKLFCVKGNTPQPQYSFIRISHDEGQFEFRLFPVSGNFAKKHFENEEVYQLRQGDLVQYDVDDFRIAFQGSDLLLDVEEMSNPEWVLGQPPPPSDSTAIKSVSSNSQGNLPQQYTYIDEEFGPDRYVSSAQRGGAYFTYLPHNVNNVLVRAGSFPTSATLVTGGRKYEMGRSYREYEFPIPPFPPRSDDPDDNTEWDPFDNDEVVGNKYSIKLYELRQESAVETQTVEAEGGSGSGAKFKVRKWSNGSYQWELVEGGSGYKNGEQITIPFANVTVRVTTPAGDIAKNNDNTYDAISDYPQYDAERKSHQDNPEFEIVYVNEQLEQAIPQYDDLAIAGLRMNTSKEWTSLSNLSAYIKRGVVVERLTEDGRSATNLMPEIAYALLTDTTIGAGTLVGEDQVDRDRMVEAAEFCLANDYTWDGIIDSKQNLRQWIFENAGYCLLDFTIIGGRFSLVPAVPVNDDNTIDFDAEPDIKCLFTDGVIRNMKVTFLSPEERQLFQASVLWRQETDNGFPETRTVNVRFSDDSGGSDADPVEAFDMSGFCTNEDHALDFARYALKLRKEVDHAVTFETTPQAAMGLTPGDHFRLVSEATHTSRFENGSIGSAGAITAVDTMDGTFDVLYWVPGTETVLSAEMVAEDNHCTTEALWGSVFTLDNTTTVNRVYKVESLTYSDEGLVEVAGSYEPLEDDGTFTVLDWTGTQFVVETN